MSHIYNIYMISIYYMCMTFRKTQCSCQVVNGLPGLQNERPLLS